MGTCFGVLWPRSLADLLAAIACDSPTNGTVPVLRDGDGEPFWETGAILRTLAARYASAPFWPEEGPARVPIDKWAEWAKILRPDGIEAVGNIGKQQWLWLFQVRHKGVREHFV